MEVMVESISPKFVDMTHPPLETSSSGSTLKPLAPPQYLSSSGLFLLTTSISLGLTLMAISPPATTALRAVLTQSSTPSSFISTSLWTTFFAIARLSTAISFSQALKSDSLKDASSCIMPSRPLKYTSAFLAPNSKPAFSPAMKPFS
ncbi:MAG: hypothetical protein A2V21_300290 [Deltaproteobacteria bacterium GWC2_55_46]|nr:MAG: hypothetical protein A3I81_03155 [Deltaproteobacteria bacterium RIFCSPLOWO2_02_FULL_55_12]OIJ72829.1 MAG: hypothetical protein A2V21_300290 [Deltaproteobacteria bacterium GWC2_55_46]